MTMIVNHGTRAARPAAPSLLPARVARALCAPALGALALCALGLWAPAAVASPALAPAAPPASAAQDGNRDVVNLRNGQSELGRVKEEDFEGLELDPVKGDAKRIPWSEIATNGVTYADPQWQAIADLLATNKYAEALPLLEELKADTKLRAPVRQNVLYFEAVALQRSGDADKALGAYLDLVKAFPNSRYLMEVGEALVTIHSAKKDYAGATRAIDDMAAGAAGAFAPAAGVLKGLVFEAQKDWPKAGAAYSVAARASGVSPLVQLRAELGEARALAAQNKKTEAESALRKLVSKDGPNALMAGVWNGLADLAYERARAANNNKGDAEQMLDALYMYLRGVVQYAPLPGEAATEYQRALRGTIQAFEALGQIETVAERKRLYQARAKQRKEQYDREFPSGG